MSGVHDHGVPPFVRLDIPYSTMRRYDRQGVPKSRQPLLHASLRDVRKHIEDAKRGDLVADRNYAWCIVVDEEPVARLQEPDDKVNQRLVSVDGPRKRRKS
jgi:hypothetical protein